MGPTHEAHPIISAEASERATSPLVLTFGLSRQTGKEANSALARRGHAAVSFSFFLRALVWRRVFSGANGSRTLAHRQNLMHKTKTIIVFISLFSRLSLMTLC